MIWSVVYWLVSRVVVLIDSYIYPVSLITGLFNILILMHWYIIGSSLNGPIYSYDHYHMFIDHRKIGCYN